MKHDIPHPLDVATAKTAVEKAFASYREQYPSYEPKLTWKSDRDAAVSLSAKGVSLDGTLAVREGKIELDLDVPFLLRVFQKKAVEVIDREVRKWIAKAQAGQL